MDSSVLALGDLRTADAQRAGGKAANLGELVAKGFPVPPGFVVSAEACRAFFESLGLGVDVRSLDGARKADLARRCSELQRKIVEGGMPGPLSAAILAAHARLVGERGGGVSCAVRSSATAEDLAGASFAGQHGTYYYVDEVQLLEMVRRCWASLWSPEAVAYRATHGIPHESTFMAVVVQEMVRSEISGVAFTANPVSGELGEIVIESSWGMGAAIVDGRVTPDRHVVARPGLELRERRIAEKRFMVPTRLQAGGGERLVAVPHEMRRREALSHDQVRTVAEWSLRCEQHFGAPQDVEWAITDERFYLLQSRPITSLGRQEPGMDVKGKYVLFKALAENFTDPVTPLTADLVSLQLPPGFRLIGGRFYMDLERVRPIVPFKISDEDLAKLLYLSAVTTPLRVSLLRLPVALLAQLLFYLAFGLVLARTRSMPDDFMDCYRARCREVGTDPALDPAAALRRLWLLPDLLDPVGNMPMPVNGSSMRFAPWMAALKLMLRRWVPGLRADAVALLCSGSEGVLSAEMGRSIWTLAREAKAALPVREILVRHEPDEALARLREEPAARGFVERLGGFLAVHGHRAIKEFELQSARWEENPAPVLGMVRNYLLVEGDPAAPEEKAARARLEVEAEIRRALETRPLERLLGLRGRLVSLAARRSRYYLKLRENSRFYHIMALGAVRKKILAIEAELRREGRLKCKDDIFFLRSNEVSALRSGRLGWLDVEDRIRERRIEHVRLAKITPPKTIGIEQARRPAEEPSEADRLEGQSASPGRYEGIARVILDPSVDSALTPGEVLVAPYTDPAWTPLFLTAGAAVVEVGSYLSHAGTVAREFGMPCVVDVADCTRRIQSGLRVEVDGSRGVVRILGGGGA